MGCIYKITNKVNGKAYIGKTTRDPERRVIYEHLNRKKHGCQHLERAIQKYGKENFTWEILHDGILPKLLDSFEIEAIKKHNTLSPNGYNLTEGGEGGIPAQEVRKRLSDSRKGEKHPNYGKISHFAGKKHTKKSRERISESQKGEKNHNYGKKASKETRQKMSESRRGKKNAMYGRSHSIESRRKMSEKRKHPEREKAYQIYLSISPSKDISEKRKIIRDITGLDYRLIWQWVKAWEQGKT